MGLFDFIKNLISGAKNFEGQVEGFVKEIETKSTEVGAELKAGLEKAKKVTAEVETKVAEVEAKVKKATAPKAKKPEAPKATKAAPKKAATKIAKTIVVDRKKK